MEREQIARFLERWCAAAERFHTPNASETALRQRAESEENALLAAIDASEGVRRLAGNLAAIVSAASKVLHKVRERCSA